jgi:hypothetical protein
MASNRLLGHHPCQQLSRAAVDRQLGLQLGDPFAGGDQLGPIGTIQARRLTGVNQMLPAPQVDRLLADLQIGGDRGDRPARSDQGKNPATELRRIRAGHETACTG